MGPHEQPGKNCQHTYGHRSVKPKRAPLAAGLTLPRNTPLFASFSASFGRQRSGIRWGNPQGGGPRSNRPLRRLHRTGFDSRRCWYWRACRSRSGRGSGWAGGGRLGYRGRR
jgi:hypothetical protein